MHGWYAAARVAGAKGLDGKLRLLDASAFLRSDPLDSSVAFVPPVEDAPRFAQVASVEEIGEDACFVRFQGIDSAERAQSLRGCTLLLEGNEQDASADAASLAWLAGFTVEDATAGPIGIVVSVDDDPCRVQPLMHVRCEKRESPVLIPLVDDLIVSVDEQHERIIMELPVGILDI